MARTMGDASKVAVAGGDGSNLYYFYTGGSYKDNSVENIAAFAQEHFDSCKGKSVEDIESKHIFWGSEGIGYKGFYNGDTYVLFDDVEKLPQDVKQDALTYCKGYREEQQSAAKDAETKGVSPSEFDPVKIKYISDSCVEPKVGKDGSPYYRIGVSVGKSFSENGFANINVSKGVEKRNNVWSVDFPDNKMINMNIVQNGKHKVVSRAVSDLADAHAEHLVATKGQRRLPNVPEVADEDKSLQME